MRHERTTELNSLLRSDANHHGRETFVKARDARASIRLANNIHNSIILASSVVLKTGFDGIKGEGDATANDSSDCARHQLFTQSLECALLRLLLLARL